MSAIIEHQIVFVGIFSASWKWYLNSPADSSILIPIFSTLLSILALYFSYTIERKWTTWNCEKLTFWIHQLKNVNRLPQMLGFWCTFLPLWLSFFMTFSNQNHHRFPAILLMITCPLTLRFLLFNFVRKWKLSALIADLISTVIAFGLLRSVIDLPLTSAFALSILPSLMNLILIPKLMTTASKSFTLGEFHLLYSAVFLTLVSSIGWIATAVIQTEFDSILLLLAWSLITCVVFSTLCFVCSIIRRSAIAFWLVFFANVLTAYLFCLFLNGFDMLSWTAEFMVYGSSDHFAYRRWILLTFWLLCVACTIRFAIACWTMPRLGTVHRKYFHLTIGMVIISGLLFDRSLTFFASVLMLDGYVVLEIIRLCDVEPIGSSVREIFSKYLDHQDQGPLVLTPTYLLIGCFVPVWIDFPINGANVVDLRHFAGLIAVGVGDAAAAVGGTYFGRTPWRVVSNGRKTVQGTMIGFTAQVAIAFCILHWIGSLGTFFCWTRLIWVIWSCFLISMLEAFSAQVDNLILPLFAYLLFMGLH